MTDSPDILRRLAALPVANVGDAMDRLNVCQSVLRTMCPGLTLAGPAYTVRTRPGDNLYIHKALAELQPGQILVVSGGGDIDRALIGELVAGRAVAKGCAGIVIDGAVRDVAVLQALGVPVFARAITPAGPYKDGPGELDVPIAVADVVVKPGDYVLGDDDGVVVVPRERAETVVERAEDKQRQEDAKRTEIAAQLGLEAFPTGA
ncbi:methyltransferase [Streptomyces argyrophyllae]|uniref:Putative 4-hydroxy-4-methyl-2-oxoglutarate aldolase n=1 Tax=Streptomyces argyrophylli TaxID=2726118 RepID=A0A6M4PSH9_9ACTN|nr:methyltransferase [Streptomyces argyrophyllae]QJS13951.1 methyltransferase [Streptomyces argyrophyllae]